MLDTNVNGLVIPVFMPKKRSISKCFIIAMIGIIMIIKKKMWMNLVKIVPNSSTAYLFMPIEDKAILVGIEGVICKRM